MFYPHPKLGCHENVNQMLSDMIQDDVSSVATMLLPNTESNFIEAFVFKLN